MRDYDKNNGSNYRHGAEQNVRHDSERRNRYRDDPDAHYRNSQNYRKRESRETHVSSSSKDYYTHGDEYHYSKNRRRYREDPKKDASLKERRQEGSQKNEVDDEKYTRRYRQRRSGKTKLKSNGNLQMFPFIDPEKAAILAGNTLLPYAVSIKNRVYIGNMGPDITPEDLRSALNPFGVVLNVGMGRPADLREGEQEGTSKGFCFVDFADTTSAEKLLSLDPPVIRIFGRLLRVVETRFHLDNIEKERFMSVENASLLLQAGIIEKIEESPSANVFAS